MLNAMEQLTNIEKKLALLATFFQFSVVAESELGDDDLEGLSLILKETRDDVKGVRNLLEGETEKAERATDGRQGS